MLKIKKNIILSSYTTFRIGGRAKYFFSAQNKKEIIQAVNWAKKKNLDFFILGGGSNILVSDSGFDGLVIRLDNKNYKVNGNIVSVEAGMPLNELVKISIDNNLSGLEWAVGIPGTIGGAICGNTGAFGHSISDFILSVEILKNKEIKILQKEDCSFSYRNSLFKNNRNIVILSAKFKLKKDNKKKSKEMLAKYLNQRKITQPVEPSAGCIFKNPFCTDLSKINKKLAPIKDNRISAGWLIEECGLKGYKIGQAQISKKHANFIINCGQAKAEDVIILISLTKQKVRDRFNIQLEEEIKYVGF
ncbi:UDP-N-acetylmuramate dehydrogenase [bacterium]|nr:UDP-N-acetylmuramate dehydrogenase [bacterium]